VNQSLWMDVKARAFPMMISAFKDIFTWLLLTSSACGGRLHWVLMAAVAWAVSLSHQSCQLWTTVSLDTGGPFSLPAVRVFKFVLAGRL
jgi:hypothetical protein